MIEVVAKAREFTPYEAEQASTNNVSLPAVLPHSPEFLFNRDLSLLEFFSHVLDEGLDESQPLLERLKFLTIFSSNLDEFFMIRVSGLKEKSQYENALSADGMTPEEQLMEVRTRLLTLLDRQSECLNKDVLPKLSERGIVVADFKSLNETERANLITYFKDRVFPVLTPQAVDHSHPFPYISGGSLNLGLMVKPKVTRRVKKALFKTGDEFFVRIKIPPFVPRFVPVAGSESKFVLIEDLISSNIQLLLPEANESSCHFFRITRDADIEVREEEAADLLEKMEENLKQRRFGDIVRLEVSESMPQSMINYLVDSMDVSREDIYQIKGALNIAEFMSLYKIDRPELKEKKLNTFRPAIMNSSDSMFDIIKRQDILLHHPYMPYTIVTDFLKEAVEDKNVLAIKMCLYRTGADSPIPPLLIKASELGKQVTVLIELKARFDEENNIGWAKRLEEAGVHVVYGIMGLKTHCKTTLVVRREGEELRRYVHLATGNYNPVTSAFYTDLGLLTDDEKVGADASDLFNFLTAYVHHDEYRKLLVAPRNLREKMVAMINRETENAREGKPARIVAKMNRLADTEIIRALYEASQAGVEIDLIVRGVCMLRPGVKGLSETIRVRSIVGSLLEHSRVYYFANGGADEIYMGSSDWMPRNLDRRVEVLTPIEDPAMKHYLKDEFLPAYLRDTVKARILTEDGSYVRANQDSSVERFDSQMSFQGNLNVLQFDRNH